MQNRKITRSRQWFRPTFWQAFILYREQSHSGTSSLDLGTFFKYNLSASHINLASLSLKRAAFSKSGRSPSKHETLNQCWGNVGPLSTTSGHHWPNIGICWGGFHWRPDCGECSLWSEGGGDPGVRREYGRWGGGPLLATGRPPGSFWIFASNEAG